MTTAIVISQPTGTRATTGSTMPTAAVVVAAILLSGCSRSDIGSQGNPGNSRVVTNSAGQRGISAQELERPNQPDTTAGNTSDDSLAQKVRVALSTGTTGTTGVYSEDLLLGIRVTASNGVVTLSGDVGNQSSRNDLATRAAAIQGVTGVRNELRVVEGASRPRPGAPSGRGQTDAVPQQSSPQPEAAR